VFERAEQIQRDRGRELGPREDPQRLGVGGVRVGGVPVRIAARQERREREEQLVHEPGAEQLRVQVRSALAQQRAHAEALV